MNNFEKLYRLIDIVPKYYFDVTLAQVRNQEFFRVGEVSWKRGTSINVSCMAYKRKAPTQKNFHVFFSKTLQKLYFK